VAALLGPLDAAAVDTLLRSVVVAVGDRSGWNVGRMRADGALAPLASSYDGLRGLVQRFRPPPPGSRRHTPPDHPKLDADPGIGPEIG
jgi:hypothetical protein